MDKWICIKNSDLAALLLAVAGIFCFSGHASAAGDKIDFLSLQKNNVFVGEGARLEVHAKGVHFPPDSMARVEIRDESGRLVKKMLIDLGVAHPAIRLSGVGYYSVEVSAMNQAGAAPARLGKTDIAIIPPIKPDEHSPFGIWHVHGDLHVGAIAGARWDRRMYTLRDYQLGKHGKIVPAPLHYMPVVHSIPGYVVIDTLAFGLPDFLKTKGNKSSSFLYPPTDWSKFETLVAQFAKDLPYTPQYFSIYNEPEVHWRGSQQDLGRFLTTIARAIKKVHPETKVLGPGLATIKIDMLRRFAALGLFDHLDGFATNAYVNGTKPENEFIGRVRELKKFLAEIGHPKMPIYITEFGWTTAGGTWQRPVDELTQAQYAARSMALLRSEGVKAAIYFCLLYKTKNPGEQAFSVLRASGEPKPAYVSIATAARMLGHGGKPSLIENTDGTRLLQLDHQNDAGVTLVIWDEKAGRSIFFPGKYAKSAVDMMGHKIELSGNIRIGESPVYLKTGSAVSFPPLVLSALHVSKGKSLPVPGLQYISVPQPIRAVNNHTVTVPVNAEPGTYWLIGNVNKRITVLPVVVGS